MRVNKIYILSIAILFFFLLWSVPASQVCRLLHNYGQDSNITIIGTDGNWHNGSCRWLQMDNITINDLNWQLQPLYLFTQGRMIFAFNTSAKSPIHLQGSLFIKLDGNYKITGFYETNDKELQSALAGLGQPATNGKIPLSITGRL